VAYEDMTYEAVLQRMTNRVKEKHPNLDNREGSLIFNANAPASAEFAIAYTAVDNATKESFVETASREYKLLGCKDKGMNIEQFEASFGVHKGEFNVEVPIGSRWNCDLYNYVVVEYLGLEGDYHTYSIQCETIGTTPNNQTGDLTPITDHPSGLTHARVTECLIEGENERTDDEITQAYYEYISSSIADGNVAQYKHWCSEYDGIGHYKVFPLWNGNGTVKVSILSASNKRASDELIAEFQEYLDPNTTGMGNGVAPIGAFVTVTTATEKTIDVNANLVMKNGYSDTTPVKNAISDYLASIAYEKTQVAYMNIGATILNVEGVESVNNLTVNGGTADITLGAEEIPVLARYKLVVV
jgi:uncharacterized phage protein gp47/JayE